MTSLLFHMTLAIIWIWVGAIGALIVSSFLRERRRIRRAEAVESRRAARTAMPALADRPASSDVWPVVNVSKPVTQPAPVARPRPWEQIVADNKRLNELMASGKAQGVHRSKHGLTEEIPSDELHALLAESSYWGRS